MRKILSTMAFLCLAPSAFSQISGVVVDDATNEPLVGVSVVQEGTTNGTITNVDGEFSLNVAKGTPLKIRYMGYIPQTVKAVQGMNVQLKEQVQELSDVIVIGYGVQRKSDITGAISSISGKDVQSAPVANAVQALEGRASGVQVITNTGSPGGSTTIKIRGTGTVNNSDPLYVVDGFIVDNIDHINPYDIQNVEVLKDAASSSIYGARSANGVILITTKEGKSGKPQVTLDTYWSVSSPWKKIDVMEVEDFALMRDYVTGLSNYSVDGKLYYSKDGDGNYYFDDGKYHRLDSIKTNS
ncbi:MAG: TonB-dependent receptor plug domain-containing protein, partial [Alloprevotella sp.]